MRILLLIFVVIFPLIAATYPTLHSLSGQDFKQQLSTGTIKSSVTIYPRNNISGSSYSSFCANGWTKFKVFIPKDFNAFSIQFAALPNNAFLTMYSFDPNKLNYKINNYSESSSLITELFTSKESLLSSFDDTQLLIIRNSTALDVGNGSWLYIAISQAYPLLDSHFDQYISSQKLNVSFSMIMKSGIDLDSYIKEVFPAGSSEPFEVQIMEDENLCSNNTPGYITTELGVVKTDEELCIESGKNWDTIYSNPPSCISNLALTCISADGIWNDSTSYCTTRAEQDCMADSSKQWYRGGEECLAINKNRTPINAQTNNDNWTISDYRANEEYWKTDLELQNFNTTHTKSVKVKVNTPTASSEITIDIEKNEIYKRTFNEDNGDIYLGSIKLPNALKSGTITLTPVGDTNMSEIGNISAIVYLDQETECINNGGIWDNDTCITPEQQCTSQGKLWEDNTCKTAAESCNDGGGVWENNTCTSNQQICTSQGKIWENNTCKTAAESCNDGGGIWNGSTCTTSAEKACTDKGWDWNPYESRCFNPTPPPPPPPTLTAEQSCLKANKYWVNNSCLSSSEYLLYNAKNECLQKTGNIWENNLCITEAEILLAAAKVACLEKDDNLWENNLCKSPEEQCTDAGKIWEDTICKTPEEACTDTGMIWTDKQTCVSEEEAKCMSDEGRWYDNVCFTESEKYANHIVNEILNIEYNVIGYFLHIDTHWVYISADGLTGGTLLGVNGQGMFVYDKWQNPLTQTKRYDITFDEENIYFSKLDNLPDAPVDKIIIENSYQIAGKFIHYKGGAFSWIYSTLDNKNIAKLEGFLPEKGRIEWTRLQTPDHIVFEVQPDSGKLLFSPQE